MGDLYQAARDYLHVTKHWPDQKQAYIGLIKTLIALKWTKEAQQWLDYFISLNQDLSNCLQIETLRHDIANPVTNPSKEDDEDVEMRGGKSFFSKRVDGKEQTKRLDSIDYEVRFVGHCNTTTDIKEANFLGTFFRNTLYTYNFIRLLKFFLNTETGRDTQMKFDVVIAHSLTCN